MENNEYGLAEGFLKSIEPAKQIIVDYGELLLDSKMDDGFLKQVPILSTAVKMYDFSTGLKRHIEIMKLLAFVKSTADGVDNDEERLKILEKVQKNKKEYNKSLEYMLYILSHYSDTEKAVILGRFYLAFLRGIIKFERLQMYAEIVHQLLPYELKYMKNELDGSKYSAEIKFAYSAPSVRRLVALGLCFEEIKAHSSPLMASGVEISITRHLKLTRFGADFFKIAWKEYKK